MGFFFYFLSITINCVHTSFLAVLSGLYLYAWFNILMFIPLCMFLFSTGLHSLRGSLIPFRIRAFSVIICCPKVYRAIVQFQRFREFIQRYS